MPTYLMPPIDELDSHRVLARRAHLIGEIERGVRPRPSPTRRIAAGTCLAGGAASVIGVVLGVAGPGKSSAFATWSATPRPVAPTLSDCPAGSGRAVLAERRGDYTLTMAANGEELTTCVTGDGLRLASQEAVTGSPVPPGEVRLGMSGPGRASGSAVLTKRAGQGPQSSSISAFNGELQLGNGSNGLTVLHGRVGQGVSNVRVVRADGSVVTATVAGGWFAAWWPGTEAASKVEWTADGGGHSLSVPTAPAGPVAGIPPLRGTGDRHESRVTVRRRSEIS